MIAQVGNALAEHAPNQQELVHTISHHYMIVFHCLA
jgi:hypothetical protein